jgi:hypothetical protein
MFISYRLDVLTQLCKTRKENIGMKLFVDFLTVLIVTLGKCLSIILGWVVFFVLNFQVLFSLRKREVVRN